MKKSAILIIGLSVLVLMSGVVGCGGEEATPTPDATPSPGGTQTPVATPAPTVEPITLKMVFSEPADSPSAEFNNHFADLVEERTDGRVMIDIYPGGQLFPATEQWEAVVTGSIDIMADSSYYISQAVPDVMIFYMDAMFENYEHADAVMEESEVPQILAERVEAAGPVKLLAFFSGSMTGCILNKVRETKELKDLEGLRTQSSPGSPAMPLDDYTGMVPVPISFQEIASAFIQGILDAVQLPPTAITDLMLYETGKHMMCRSNAWFFTGATVVNEDSWDRLSAVDQDIIMNEVIPELQELHKAIFREDDVVAMELIKQNVETVHWPTQEDLDPYYEYIETHAVNKVQRLMVEPRILAIIEELRPSLQTP